MSSQELEDNETADISDALINEAARLENEYRNIEEVETPDTDSNVNFKGAENSTVNKKNSTQGTLNSTVDTVKMPALSRSSPSKNSASSPTKKETNLTFEKKRAENSGLKRKQADDFLDTLRPQPPEAKQLKKDFKIPKLSKKNPSIVKALANLTEEQKQLLAALECEFSHRYTDQDEDFVKTANDKSSPPLVKNFNCPPRRQYRPEGSHYDRCNRDSSPYGHNSRHHQHKFSRNHSNTRDYPSHRDHPSHGEFRNREYPDRDNPSYRENSGSRYQHQRHQQRFQPY